MGAVRDEAFDRRDGGDHGSGLPGSERERCRSDRDGEIGCGVGKALYAGGSRRLRRDAMRRRMYFAASACSPAARSTASVAWPRALSAAPATGRPWSSSTTAPVAARSLSLPTEMETVALVRPAWSWVSTESVVCVAAASAASAAGTASAMLIAVTN